jgi:hypothetical protein
MIQPTLRDYFVGQCLQGLLANPGNAFVAEVDPMMSAEEKLEQMYSSIVEIAFELADAAMQIRKLRAEGN